MILFNSLGSNYDLDSVFKALLTQNNKKYKTELEQHLSKKFNGKTLLTYKGRQAIEIALKLLNLPEESTVAINGFTCFAVYQAIVNAGLKAAFIDIEKGDLNFSPKQLENTLAKNPKIKVVIIQNTLGYPAEIQRIAAICKKNDIFLIEDLAHSVGGKFGDFVTLSFSQDKLIDAVSGGALIIKNKKYNVKNLEQKDSIKDRFYPLFTYIIRNTYTFGLGKLIHTILKTLNLLSKPMDNNTKPSAIAPWYCSLAKKGFDDSDRDIDHRKKIASVYSQNLDKKVLMPKLVADIANSTNLRFPIIVRNRVGLINFLKKQGIFVSDIWYDAPIAPKKYISQTNYNHECPNAEIVSETILNLPTHKCVCEKEAEKISEYVNQWLIQK